MADEKKPDAKPASAPAPKPSLFYHPDPFVAIVWSTLTIIIFLYLLNTFLSFLNSLISAAGLGGSNLQQDILFLLAKLFSYLKYLLILLSLILLGLIIFYYRKLMALRKEENKSLHTEGAKLEEEINPKWKRILDHVGSDIESDWRLAVLEADIILAEILDNLALPGETIGDKLKAVDESSFKTIDNAWEAHKVRNQIAHDGSGFNLDKHEANRVIGLYETVFKEFKAI